MRIRIGQEELLNQRIFRTLLKVMSFPGLICSLSGTGIPSYQGVLQKAHGFLLGMAQTLLDHRVSFCVMGKEKDHLQKMISQLTGSRAVEASLADYVIYLEDSSYDGILSLKRGTLEFPEESATCIILVKSLSAENGRGLSITLKGPGISTFKKLFVEGLSQRVFEIIKAVNSHFPVGVDFFLLDHRGHIVGIPRSVSFEV